MRLGRRSQSPGTRALTLSLTLMLIVTSDPISGVSYSCPDNHVPTAQDTSAVLRVRVVRSESSSAVSVTSVGQLESIRRPTGGLEHRPQPERQRPRPRLFRGELDRRLRDSGALGKRHRAGGNRSNTISRGLSDQTDIRRPELEPDQVPVVPVGSELELVVQLDVPVLGLHPHPPHGALTDRPCTCPSLKLMSSTACAEMV
eukprot:TRINITY_DN751_c0_g1_i28.p1 TRINITY_DN751_c0_g1~~TRINITY_DN751_c0_g1_i28.p1  ORF type:complete len:201 (-),score=3.14 TRINITY_DN751_c0_g1_i28:317-919(-)